MISHKQQTAFLFGLLIGVLLFAGYTFEKTSTDTEAIEFMHE